MTQNSTARNYEDMALLAILDALEADLGTTGARNKLGVAHRTFAKCRDSRRLTTRMRSVLKQCVDWGPVVDNPVADIPQPEADKSYSSTEDPDQTLAQKVTDLEAENRELREAIETERAHIADWGRRLAALGKQSHKSGGERLGAVEKAHPRRKRLSLTGSRTRQSLGWLHSNTGSVRNRHWAEQLLWLPNGEKPDGKSPPRESR